MAVLNETFRRVSHAVVIDDVTLKLFLPITGIRVSKRKGRLCGEQEFRTLRKTWEIS
jgi:hypothetical protein